MRCYLTKDLDVIFDSELTFNEHVKTITKSTNKTLEFSFRNCQKFSSEVSLKTFMFHLFVPSCLLLLKPLSFTYKINMKIVSDLKYNFIGLLNNSDNGSEEFF